MSIPGLVWGYGQRGYDVLARTSQLEPWTEALFRNVGERWPFSEERESLVLSRHEQTPSGACCVLAKSRMSSGEPAHRQTVFALFRVDGLAQRWSGLLPLVKLLPPYTPEGSVLPDINFETLEADQLAVQLSFNCEARWRDLPLNQEWLLDAWLRLAMGKVIELPSCNDDLDKEIAVADLLAMTLPVRCAVKMGLSLGMRQGGTLTIGPSMTSACNTTPSNLPRTDLQPQSLALKKWLDQAVAGSEQGAGLEKTAGAIRAALVEEARQAGLKSVADVDVPHLENMSHRRLLVDWLTSMPQGQGQEAMEAADALLRNPKELPKMLQALRERPCVAGVPGPGLIGRRLLQVFERTDPSRPVNRDVARTTAELLFEGEISHGKRQMPRALPAIEYPRIVHNGPGFADAVEVYYWRVATVWLTEAVTSSAVDIGALLAQPWSEKKCRFDDQKYSRWSISPSKSAWDMLANASGRSDFRHDEVKIEAARPTTSSDPMGIECFIESFVAAVLDIASRDFELRESIYDLLWTMRKRDTM